MRDSELKFGLVFSLYLPWAVSTFLFENPVISYWIAWLGSFYIFFRTWASSSRFVLPDLPVHRQIMRPIFLQQFIFAGFMCCTSIFFFLDTIGYEYLEKVREVNVLLEHNSISTIAKCQRLFVLGHASLITGILFLQDRHLKSRPKYTYSTNNNEISWIMKVCIIAFILSAIMQRAPGLFQFSIGLYNVAIFCGSVVFIKGIRERKFNLFAFGGGVFLANMINSTLTGFKEPILVNFIILTCLVYPYYKKTVIAVAIPLFMALFYILPTYASIVRGQSWSGEVSAEEARATAFETLLSNDKSELNETNWIFLTNRFSEINMFTEFVESTPKQISYYNWDIVENSIISLIPRVLWKDKPITENLAMERVYNAGVIDTESSVSAKTRPIVDGYLSRGTVGVFLYMLFLGIVSQALSNKAENLFGGYEIGCVIMFNGFNQILWRGETMEFLINSTFWSFVAMMVVFYLLRLGNYIDRVAPAGK